MAIKLHSSFDIHPGEWLRTEIVEAHGLTVTQTAEHLGVSRQALSLLLNGHTGLSAEMALRFEKLFGLMAETLLKMQTAYDLNRVRSQSKDIKVKLFETA